MIGSRVTHLLRRAFRAAPVPPPAAIPAPGPPEQWPDELAAAGLEVAPWLNARRTRGRLYADISSAAVAALAQRFPVQAARTIAAADRVLGHEFNLLGSGPYVPLDPHRPRTTGGYRPIDWALDPVCGLRFPEGFVHSTWAPPMRPGLADIKLPWELGRCQHWVTLGQAFRLTGDERYAQEIIDEHGDFLEVNPIGIGVQYVCTMDVALRALNWALSFELIRESRALTETAAAPIYRSLFAHGVFIERNLENKYEVTSNHFLSNIIGLYGVAVVCADLPSGQRWLRQCRGWLEEEMKVQVLEDGADYESSVPYHRLVAELFLAGARLAECEGQPLSAAYLARLHLMMDFLVAVLRPDGLLPQIGDADDGRVHIFTDYGTWAPQDGRHLAAPAALILGEPSWASVGGEAGSWEAAWWGCDRDAVREVAAPAAGARLFAQAGIAVAASARAFLLVTNGRVGTNGFGNHKHNDLLAFEFHGNGRPLLVDPGSYVYTSNPDARNQFRATAYHNTLTIDDVEQNDLRSDYLFRLFETSTTEHLGFDDSPTSTEYRGRHTGYTRLPNPVIHERALRVLKDSGALLIVDRLHGTGRHGVRWHFHLAPGVEVEAVAAGEYALVTSGGRWRFHVPRVLSTSLTDAWYSPSYGVRVPCRALDCRLVAEMSADHTYMFSLAPEEWLASGAFAGEQAAFQADLDARGVRSH